MFPSKIPRSNIKICAPPPSSISAPQLQTTSHVSWWQHSCFASRIPITSFGQHVWCLWWIRVHACAAHLRVILRSVVATISKQILPTHSLKRQFLAHVCKNWQNRDYIPIIKPTRYTNFSNLFWNRTLNVSDSFSVHHQESSAVHTAIGICHKGYGDCLLGGSGCSILIPLASSQHNLYDIYLLLCVQRWTHDDGQRNYPKHVEFYSEINLRN